MNNPVIEIKSLEKHFGRFSLGPLDLSVPQGCIVGYIGENGSGKSTTLKLILGLLRADAGKIMLWGQPIQEMNPSLMNRIGVVFDDLNLPREMTVKEVGRFCRFSFDTWEEKTFQEHLERFGLPLGEKLKNLSRGMKMKLSLAIALSHKAELLILDEATSGLDPVVRDDILDLLLDFLQDKTHAVMISSHVLSDLEKAADYIALLHEGRLLLMEHKDELKDHYALCSVDDETAASLPTDAILGQRKHAFGQELLVKRELMPEGIELSKPTIEDIMVYFVKGVKNESPFI
ncbi:MAG: ABC transporter ATP-binding protein [Clostridiaceae bacterium]|nr:ABC transporter ATP-binding protein [Clostridiaceae bacterium]